MYVKKELIITEMQVKTTMRYHLTTVRMAILKKTRNKVLVRMWRKGNPHALSVGMYIYAATMENNTKVPQKIKNRTTSNSISGYLVKKTKTTNLKRHMHPHVHCSSTYNSQDMEAT